MPPPHVCFHSLHPPGRSVTTTHARQLQERRRSRLPPEGGHARSGRSTLVAEPSVQVAHPDAGDQQPGPGGPLLRCAVVALRGVHDGGGRGCHDQSDDGGQDDEAPDGALAGRRLVVAVVGPARDEQESEREEALLAKLHELLEEPVGLRQALGEHSSSNEEDGGHKWPAVIAVGD